MTLEQLQQFYDDHRWRSLADSQPTEVDANDHGEIDFWSPDHRACTDTWSNHASANYTHWRKIIPPQDA